MRSAGDAGVATPPAVAPQNAANVAVIIANKNYRYASGFPVEYAINDANSISRDA
jgi:hypothetical protein